MLGKFFIFFLTIFFLTGCSLAPVYKSFDKTTYETSTNFSNLTDSLMEELSSRTSEISYYSSDSLIITDFVNINSLDNKSTLGFILSNELKTSLNKRFPNMSLKELTLGKDIKIGSNGVKILSRKLKELKTNKSKKGISLSIQSVDSNILNRFINRVLNEKLSISKLDIKATKISLEVRI